MKGNANALMKTFRENRPLLRKGQVNSNGKYVSEKNYWMLHATCSFPISVANFQDL